MDFSVLMLAPPPSHTHLILLDLPSLLYSIIELEPLWSQETVPKVGVDSKLYFRSVCLFIARFFESAKIFEKNISHRFDVYLNLCGDFFQILWPSQNISTLAT